MNGQRVALIPFNMIKWLLQVKSEVNSWLINESSKSKRGICFWSWGGAHRLFWVLRRGKCHQKGALCHENTQSCPNNLLGVRALRKELTGVKKLSCAAWDNYKLIQEQNRDRNYSWFSWIGSRDFNFFGSLRHLRWSRNSVATVTQKSYL